MRNKWIMRASVFIFATICSIGLQATQDSSPGTQYLGTWTGTWEGSGTGGFELTLEKKQDGTLGGRVSVTGEPTYKAVFRTVSFDGPKMSAKYDFPPDESIEIALTATFDGKAASGTWAAVSKSNGSELASGTWTVKAK